eukprot:CAMPEP_0183720976 /NCGR_PEP_ID=MMETSP0737-20130205/13437_1 /TAXON_ID=385413 /ORGANISM="Thalassiosira miniscula, Strain CCMP1093" /LENGTH=522 /DNA_ID=CAMNT_0025950935 /DNA_START=296 /DNA_END=1864 /DNA_ORIENTATION=+
MSFSAFILSAARWNRPIMPTGIHALMTPLPSNNKISRTSGRFLSPERRWNSAIGSANVVSEHSDETTTAKTTATTNENENPPSAITKATTRNKKKALKSGREKRRKFIGLAKAVDRGQWQNTYSPGGSDGTSFVAKSGLPDVTKPFCVLGIESSCDDTGAAIIRSDGTILGESLASQHAIHEEWGGVVPGLAKTAHEENIDKVIQSALKNANMQIEDVDAIGVTVGPGLEICLRVGCNKGRELAMKHNKPFVGVHHLEAHILMARIPSEKYKNDSEQSMSDEVQSLNRAMEFPFLALLVSGGHCQILKCLGIGKYSILGGTLDDSLGEAFDKTARLLGLPVGGGGGPAVEALAKDGDPKSVKLPIPLQKRKDCDFSYAGLKTAVRLAAEKICVERGVETVEELSHEDKANIAASFQHVAFRHVEIRLNRAMEQVQQEDGIQTLAVVGGVAANKELRRRLDGLCSDRSEPWEMLVPPPRLCTDQGAMSAWAAVERLMVGSSDVAEGHEVFARYPFSLSPSDES